ncbi:MAG: hypothetical protein WCK59_01370 [Candidatus Falkowbacteria bacterium]
MTQKEGLYHLLVSRVIELSSQKGLKFILGKPVLKDGKMLIDITGKVKTSFVVSNEGEEFFLWEKGAKIAFLKEDLVDHMLIEANNGPKLGELMPKDWAKRHFSHLEVPIIT